MFKAQINGTTIAYEMCGEGVPLLLIHGALVHHGEWKPQLNALSQSFRLIMPDVRGHGESDPSNGPYSIQQFADDLIGLLDTLKIERTLVLGHSMGGSIALQMAADHPERVHGLVLAESIFGLRYTNLRLRLVWAAASATMRIMGLKRAMARSAERQLTTASPEIQAQIKEIYQKHAANPRNFWNIWNANGQFDGRNLLDKVQCPTLILIAEHSRATRKQGHYMAATIQDAQLHVIPKTRHGLNWDNAEAFNTTVIEFFKKVIHGRETE